MGLVEAGVTVLVEVLSRPVSGGCGDGPGLLCLAIRAIHFIVLKNSVIYTNLFNSMHINYTDNIDF